MNFTNSTIQMNIARVQDSYNIDQIDLRTKDSWRYCSNGMIFRIKNEKIRFHEMNTGFHEKVIVLIDNTHHIQMKMTFRSEVSNEFMSIDLFSLKKNIKNFIFELNINFDKRNLLDYVALSGNLYKNVKNQEKINIRVNEIGAFSGVFTACSKGSSISFIASKESFLNYLQFKKNRKETKIKANLHLKKQRICHFSLYLGNNDYIEPIKLKFRNLIPLKFAFEYLDKAKKAYYTLNRFFTYKTHNGLIPANFIHYPMRKKDILMKSPTSSYGNCFSLGAIYGTSALYLWTKDPLIKDSLLKFLTPVIEDAQIKEGPLVGAFLDTYSHKKSRWETGRVQFKEGGFSDWMPYIGKELEKRKAKGINFRELFTGLKRDFFVRKSEFLPYFIWAFKLAKMSYPQMKLKIPKLVIFPAYTGQFAYFILQTYLESTQNGDFLGKDFEQKLVKSLDLSAQFLVKTQRKNNIWDHELYIDGEVFWTKETLACIFPATFLIWYGTLTNNQRYYDTGLKALERCIQLQERNEYYGMYFETDLSINQADLVTAIACIKCYCKLYEILHKEKYLMSAKRAAWHVISGMWGDIKDKKNKPITGGLLVTTHKNLGFPVIGGSELCQTFEAFCELSKYDSEFLRFTEALLGFCQNYLIYEGERTLGIYEIIFGYSDNWTSSCSADFASYASGPFIRGLYLLNNLKIQKPD